MSDLLGRARQVAMGYLDAARGRLEDIDARAQDELRQSLPREARSSIPNTMSPETEDPFARAAAKIAAAQQQVAEQHRQQEAASAVTVPAPTDPVTTAYKIIGLPPGTAYETVRTSVDQLRARCAPSRFPDSSSEQAEAQVILARVEEAFQVLQNALVPAGGGRFDKLEL
jgi:hypothetical protein